jgi:copper chaperone CopZ
MKKTYLVKNLECAHCAEKMERAINKIKGVEEASITFMTQKLFIEADDDRFNEIIAEAIKAIKKIEKDVELEEI